MPREKFEFSVLSATEKALLFVEKADCEKSPHTAEAVDSGRFDWVIDIQSNKKPAAEGIDKSGDDSDDECSPWLDVVAASGDGD